MSDKAKRAMTWIASLFIGGIVVAGIGMTKGQDIASFFSRPMGEEFWSISGGMLVGWTYIPIMIGVSMMILAIVFATVLFIHWLQDPANPDPETPSEGAQTAD